MTLKRRDTPLPFLTGAPQPHRAVQHQGLQPRCCGGHRFEYIRPDGVVKEAQVEFFEIGEGPEAGEQAGARHAVALVEGEQLEGVQLWEDVEARGVGQAAAALEGEGAERGGGVWQGLDAGISELHAASELQRGEAPRLP